MRIADLLALRPGGNEAFTDWVRAHPAENGRALFGSATLGRVLGLLTLHPDRAFSMATVVYSLSGNYESTHRALHRLVDAGIVQRERRGRELLFTFRRDHPLLAALRATTLQQCTVGPRLRWAREELGASALEVAFVFGSMASLPDRPSSDLDLLVVGSISLSELHPYLSGLSGEIDRPINAVCRSRARIQASDAEGHSFDRSVWSQPRIPVLGTDRDIMAVIESHAPADRAISGCAPGSRHPAP